MQSGLACCLQKARGQAKVIDTTACTETSGLQSAVLGQISPQLYSLALHTLLWPNGCYGAFVRASWLTAQSGGAGGAEAAEAHGLLGHSG